MADNEEKKRRMATPVDRTNYNINPEVGGPRIPAGVTGYNNSMEGRARPEDRARFIDEQNQARLARPASPVEQDQMFADAQTAIELNAAERNNANAEAVRKSSGLTDLQNSVMAERAKVNKYVMDLAERAEMGGSAFIKRIGNPAMDTLRSIKGLMGVEAGSGDVENLAKAGLQNTSADLAPDLAQSEIKRRTAQDILDMAQAKTEPSKAKYYEGLGTKAMTDTTQKGAFEQFKSLSADDQKLYLGMMGISGMGFNDLATPETPASATAAVTPGMEAPTNYLTNEDIVGLTPSDENSIMNRFKRKKESFDGFDSTKIPFPGFSY